MFVTRRAAVLLALVALGAADAVPAKAEGASLTGLMAPELTFPGGVKVAPGTTLSSFRGKVVWLKFWLRDCPRCRKTLPEAQRLHDLYGESGLVVLTVVHQYGADQVVNQPFFQQGRYTFRVASDPTGALAQAYQVNHRPTDYVIGVNGRVVASNDHDLEVIKGQLKAYRKEELGPVPAGVTGVLEAVQAGDYGSYGQALRLATSAAAAPEASAEVRAFAARVETLARGKLEVGLRVAQLHWDGKDLKTARETYEGLAKDYAETSLGGRAKEALDAFVAATAKGA